MKTIEIGGKQIPLKYSLKSMMLMEETIGKIADITELLKGEKRVRTLAKLIVIFAKSADCDIELNWVLDSLPPARFMEAYIIIMDVYAEGMRTEDDISGSKEVDLGLAEIERKKGKGLTYRLMTALALRAGLTFSEAQEVSPGMIFDLFLHRRKYDDAQHGIRRE